MSSDQNTHQMALPTGYQLEQYRIEAQLGHGGFGITYRALDTRLDRQVAIKEYLPRDLAFRNSGQTVQAISQSDHEMFEWGLERFLDEARILAKFNHPNIVRVLQFFRANDTAYLVMEYCDGEPLDQILQREGRLQPDQVLQITNSLLDALTEFHKLDVIHRDIKPANIYIRSDGTPVLLDFGSARQAVVGRSRSMTSVLSPHYAAFEQYSTHGKQGPWTDLYGLAATMYHCITGERPLEATERVEEDELVPITQTQYQSAYSKNFIHAIEMALAPLARNRTQTAAEWKDFVNDRVNDNTLIDESEKPAKPIKPKETSLSKKLRKLIKYTAITILVIFLILVASFIRMMEGSRPTSNNQPVNLTYRECNIVASQTNRTLPRRIDELTITKYTKCIRNTPKNIFQVNLEVSADWFNASHLREIRPGIIHELCTDQDMLNLLRMSDIEYKYRHSSGATIGSMRFNLSACR